MAQQLGHLTHHLCKLVELLEGLRVAREHDGIETELERELLQRLPRAVEFVREAIVQIGRDSLTHGTCPALSPRSRRA